MASPPPIDGSAALVAHLATFPDDVPLQGILRAMRDWSPAQRANFTGAVRACFPEACVDGGWPNIRDENARLREALDAVQALDTPYPLREVLEQLADAADHLLGTHSCDAHGYEGVGLARDAARRMVAVLGGADPEKTAVQP